MSHFSRSALVLLFATALGSAAQAGDWTVSRVSGLAWMTTKASERIPLATGAVVGPGSSVSTKGATRVILANGQDTMVLGPNTLVTIPINPDAGMETTVRQQTGQIELQVQKTGRPHFSVKTPFLAAVVKGTKFSVTVTPTGADVTVKEGRVAVSDAKNGRSVDVTPGQKASVGAGSTKGPELSGLGVAKSTASTASSAKAGPKSSPKAGRTENGPGRLSPDRTLALDPNTGPSSPRPDDTSKPDQNGTNGKPGKDRPSKPGKTDNPPGKGDDAGNGHGKPDKNKPGKDKPSKPQKPSKDKPGKEKPGKDGDHPGKGKGPKGGKGDKDKSGKGDTGSGKDKPGPDKPGKGKGKAKNLGQTDD